ncbi:MAG: hypothetical protein M4579_004869 [Chaenotheca gracillima]|nr:MAG: hypothetical protein M4579_004869 [Chaenotheca gracillima]
MLLGPRLSLETAIQRQIVEGVQAVVRLSRRSQSNGKIPLRVFDRRAGENNVRFDEYDDLDPNIAAELVFRAKQTHGAPAPVSYNQPQGYQAPQYGQPYSTPPQTQSMPLQAPAGNQGAAAPNLANLISSLDGPSLQKLLGTLQQQAPQLMQQQPHQHHQAPQQQSAAGMPADLASLLGGMARTTPQQQQPFQPPQGPSNPYASFASNPAFAGNPALASLLGANGGQQQHQQQQPPPMQHQQPSYQQAQPAQQVQNIMEQLAKWKQ